MTFEELKIGQYFTWLGSPINCVKISMSSYVETLHPTVTLWVDSNFALLNSTTEVFPEDGPPKMYDQRLFRWIDKSDK